MKEILSLTLDENILNHLNNNNNNNNNNGK